MWMSNNSSSKWFILPNFFPKLSFLLLRDRDYKWSYLHMLCILTIFNVLCDSTEVERLLRNLILDSFARSRVQTPLEAKRIEKSIRVLRVLVFSFAWKKKARCLLQHATKNVFNTIKEYQLLLTHGDDYCNNAIACYSFMCLYDV